jgi:microcystin-dependent protein
MSEPFLAEIRIFGFTFAPRGWAFCDGQILPINQNQSLYSLLGTTYGGDGRTSFALPDLRGRTPIHVGSSNSSIHLLGSKGGEENNTLGTAEMPSHDHTLQGTDASGNNPIPTSNVLGAYNNAYGTPQATEKVSPVPGTLANTGNSQGHNNMMPFLVLNFGIALQGIFPSRN